ncbi:MAG: YggS family pyridoxal phosphate-dependent enzyme [Gammaproteobacteria bacterium]|nr:MAG: YggS family pyridoxal phosphate-dependent enzyme [Gammaproteobacteria bacterium]
MSIAYHLKKVYQRIDNAVSLYDRKSLTPHPVTLLAVSKTHKINKIQEAFEAGQREFGENYLQEAVDKIITLKDLPISWHYIGPIQSNKTAKIAQHFDWVHSVDRLKIARRLSQQRPENLSPLNICLQVNISAEVSKSGLSPEELPELLEQIHQLPGIKLRGLMCIPAKTDSFDEQRAAFHQMKLLYQQLQKQFSNLDTLSMGMSADLEAAIAEGSTIVRVGTDIFGTRNKPME